jgi:hypothetical protein
MDQPSETSSPILISSVTQTTKPTIISRPTPTTTPTPFVIASSTQTNTPITSATSGKRFMEFPTPIPGSGLEQRCVTLDKTLLEGFMITGTLVLNTNPLDRNGEDGETYLMNMVDGTVNLMTQIQGQINSTPSIHRISPNMKWFIYFEPKITGIGTKLHIRSIDGQEVPVINWDDTWGDSAEWLDDQQLIIWPSGDWLNGIIIVLNPFTGKLQKLTPNDHVISILSIDSPLIYYNPTLTRAIYQSGDSIFVLWDVQSQKDIWMTRGANFYVRPSWSPDGSQFAMVITQYDIRQSDIFLVTPDGQETQLTHLAEAYPSMLETYIEDMEWSPDGRHIAFLVSVKDKIHEIKGPTLMVVDVVTKQITDYCVVVSRYSDGYLVWSPNGERLVVASPIDYQEYIETAPKGVKPHVRVVLLDIMKEVAVQIAEDMAPLGWMIAP